MDGVLSSESNEPNRAGVILYYALADKHRTAIITSRKKEDAEHWLHSHGIVAYDDLMADEVALEGERAVGGGEFLCGSPDELLRAGRSELGLHRRRAGDHEGSERRIVQRELAEDEADLLVVDVVGLELRPDVLVEGGAMRAGGGSIFDDGDLAGALVGAQRHVAQHRRLEQFGKVHGLGLFFR